MTDQQLAANRANAQRSTGPRTAEGKTKASLNAVKAALTGRTVLLPRKMPPHTRVISAPTRTSSNLSGGSNPISSNPLLMALGVYTRIPGLELAIYAQGRLQFANSLNKH